MHGATFPTVARTHLALRPLYHDEISKFCLSFPNVVERVGPPPLKHSGNRLETACGTVRDHLDSTLRSFTKIIISFTFSGTGR